MDRRTFLNWVGLGCLASSLPVVLATFSLKDQQPANAADYKALATVSQLKSSGTKLITSGVSSPVLLVLPNPQNATNVIAVNPTCTHQGCTVDWKGSEARFVCPCHRSSFTQDGSVVRGPATAPLATYDVKINGDQILVAV
ncbi:MAG: ubiquinol-cytochrome c reductase iron-sulfur subunit [Microcoleaceae cyanobacterium]